MASRMEGDYAQAILHFDRALRVLDSSVGPEFPGYMGMLREKALTLVFEDRFAEALPLYQRQLESEESSGRDADSVLLRQRIERWLATHPRD